MAKKQVRNVSNQSLYLNLPALPGVPGGRSVKLRARSTTAIDENDLDAPAMQFHLSRGNLIVVETPVAEPPATWAPESASAAVTWIDIEPLAIAAPATEDRSSRRRKSDKP
jgi:hypothetical protein